MPAALIPVPHCEHITSPRCPDAYQITHINHTIWAKSMRAPYFPCFLLISTLPSFSRARITQSEALATVVGVAQFRAHRGLTLTLPGVHLIFTSPVWTKLWVASPARTALSFSSPPFLCTPAVTLIETKAFCKCVPMFMTVFTSDGSGGPSQHSVLKGPSSLKSLQVLLVY